MAIDIKSLMLPNKTKNKTSYKQLISKVKKCKIFKIEQKEFKDINELMSYQPKSMQMQKGKVI